MRHLPHSRIPARDHGFSITELLVTVALIAVVSSVSVLAVSKITRLSQNEKLESDVRTINGAITTYLANGGSLDSITDANAVLSRLKTTLSKEDKKRHVGAPSSKMIDPRVIAVAVPEESWKLRARFDTGSKRFESITSGAGFEFAFDESLAEAAAVIETRKGGAVSYAGTSTWVWDHTATTNPSAPGGPSQFNTNPNVGDSTPVVTPPPPTPPTPPGPPPGPPVPPPPPAPVIPRLPTPEFSVAEGSRPEDEFPLSVSITNLPSSSIANAIYQIGSGAWTPYGGSVSVPMNQTLRAQFLTTNPADYQDSSVRSAYYYPVPEELSGSVESDFRNPTGGPNLKYEIAGDGDRFSHGDPVFVLDGTPINSGDPNVVGFTSQAFSNVPPGQKFVLGRFFYHNGSTYYDSHATGVILALKITLPERGETLSFNLNLDLINTPNDPDDANASADYVRITNLSQDIPLQINGVNYRIKLEFGATDSFGFSSQSQFHVYEGATGEGELLGTFLPR